MMPSTVTPPHHQAHTDTGGVAAAQQQYPPEFVRCARCSVCSRLRSSRARRRCSASTLSPAAVAARRPSVPLSVLRLGAAAPPAAPPPKPANRSRKERSGGLWGAAPAVSVACAASLYRRQHSRHPTVHAHMSKPSAPTCRPHYHTSAPTHGCTHRSTEMPWQQHLSAPASEPRGGVWGRGAGAASLPRPSSAAPGGGAAAASRNADDSDSRATGAAVLAPALAPSVLSSTSTTLSATDVTVSASALSRPHPPPHPPPPPPAARAGVAVVGGSAAVKGHGAAVALAAVGTAAEAARGSVGAAACSDTSLGDRCCTSTLHNSNHHGCGLINRTSSNCERHPHMYRGNMHVVILPGRQDSAKDLNQHAQDRGTLLHHHHVVVDALPTRPTEPVGFPKQNFAAYVLTANERRMYPVEATIDTTPCAGRSPLAFGTRYIKYRHNPACSRKTIVRHHCTLPFAVPSSFFAARAALLTRAWAAAVAKNNTKGYTQIR